MTNLERREIAAIVKAMDDKALQDSSGPSDWEYLRDAYTWAALATFNYLNNKYDLHDKSTACSPDSSGNS
jgi:hypothetical protein